MKNILITAIGSFSASSVVESLRELNINNIIGCDVYPKNWHHISKDLDEVLLAPYVSETDKYLEFIINACEQYKIDLIIPLTDIEIDFFNLHRSDFKSRDIVIAMGNSQFISIARNKLKLNQFIKKNNFNYIKTYVPKEISNASFPLIGKIFNGRSSEGIIRLNSLEELNSACDYSQYIFQEIIEGPVYTVDYIRNSLNNDFYVVPRCELLRTSNGAGMTVEVIHSKIINELANRIGVLLDIHGCVNMEFIENNDKYYLIDINPRLSAGIGFTKLAGYDMVENLYNLYTYNEIDVEKGYKSIIAEKKMVEVINKINE